MKKPLLLTLLKAGAVLAVVGLIGLGIGTWALQRYLTPQRVRDLIVSQARKSLQREVSLGEISVGLVRGLVVEKFALSERPDFKAGRFAEADSFSVRLGLLPLLHGQLAVDQVSADGLKLNVVRQSDGNFNFSDISGSTVPAGGATSTGLALSLFVKKAALRNARISYMDAAAGQDLKVAVATAKVSDFRLDGPFSADVDLRAEGKVSGRPVAAALSFSGKVDIGNGKPERMSAVIKQFRIEDSGRALRLSGKVADLAAPKLDVAATLILSGSELASVEAKGVVTSTGPRPAADLALKLHTPGFDPQNAAIKALLTFPLPKGLTVPEASLEGRLRLSGEELAFDGLKVKAKLGTIEASGRLTKLYSGRPEPELKAVVHLDVPETKAASVPVVKLPAGLVIPQATVDAGLRLKPWEATFDSLRVKTVAAQIEASGTVADLLSPMPKPQGFRAKVHLDLPRTKATSVPFVKLPADLVLPEAKVDADFTLQGWDAAINSLRVKAEGVSVDASGTVRDLMGKTQPGNLKAKAHLELPRTKASAMPFVKLPEGVVIPACVLDADLALQAWDANITSLRLKAEGATMEASGLVRDLMGKPKAQDFKAKVHLDFPATKASDIPFVKLPAGLAIPAAVVDSSLRSDGQDVTLDSFHLKTKAGEADVKGTVRKALSGQPEPDLTISTKMDLPAFKSEDIPFAQVPVGLTVPASRWEVSATGGLDSFNISRLHAVLGKNDLEASGTVKALRSGDPALDLLLKCRSFVLDELTSISPQTRDLKLSGKGFFAVGVSGPLSKFLLSGKMKFQGLGATVAGLPLSDFTGTASFDERRIDIPNLTGKVSDGTLQMDLTVKNYRAEPYIDLVASLDRFDLGQYLTAKAALAARKEERETAKPKAAPMSKAPPLATRGRFSVGELRHPNVTAKDVKVNWELDGITPDMKSLGGNAKLLVAGGNFNNIGKLATQSPLVKVLIFPLLIIQKIGSIGGIHIFPDFNNITFTEIAGDYAFDKGLMTLKDTHLYSDAAQVGSEGTIDLPSEKLDLTVTAQVARLAPMDIKVTGSFDKPVTKTQLGKFIKDLFQRAPAQEQPADQPAEGGQ